jgi:hypothetical protein
MTNLPEGKQNMKESQSSQAPVSKKRKMEKMLSRSGDLTEIGFEKVGVIGRATNDRTLTSCPATQARAFKGIS